MLILLTCGVLFGVVGVQAYRAGDPMAAAGWGLFAGFLLVLAGLDQIRKRKRRSFH